MPKKLRLLLFCFSLLICCQAFAVHNIGDSVKRILFLGNSITWAGNYVNDVDAYLTAIYPERNFYVINAGLPSETVSGLSEDDHAGGSFPRPDLHERLARVLEQTKPDLVFACYGMNDGIYLPLNNERFQKFKDGINWLHNEVLKTGARLIHITPPVYDESKGKSIGYANVLDRYSNWLLGLKKSSAWEVIDIHFPMKKYLEAHRRVDKKYGLDGFALTNDGVHPGEAGHWIMAKQILLYLGRNEVKKSASVIESLSQTIDAGRYIELVSQRDNMMRDAWLSATGHKRPGLPQGLALSEAQIKYDELTHRIKSLAAAAALRTLRVGNFNNTEK